MPLSMITQYEEINSNELVSFEFKRKTYLV
jgi:hypothetical protein